MVIVSVVVVVDISVVEGNILDDVSVANEGFSVAVEDRLYKTMVFYVYSIDDVDACNFD